MHVYTKIEYLPKTVMNLRFQEQITQKNKQYKNINQHLKVDEIVKWYLGFFNYNPKVLFLCHFDLLLFGRHL